MKSTAPDLHKVDELSNSIVQSTAAFDAESFAGALGVDAVHLMALCELDDSASLSVQSPMTPQMSSQRSRAHFGFAFLDAAAGRFYVGTATDDAARANLGAILTQVSFSDTYCHASDLAAQPIPRPALPTLSGKHASFV